MAMVFADGVMIEQVLINLLENAARYTPAGSGLEITAEATEQAVKIAVADHGPGIPIGKEKNCSKNFIRLAMKLRKAASGWV